MHITRIGADKNLDCKHPNVPVGRGKNGRGNPSGMLVFSTENDCVHSYAIRRRKRKADCIPSAERVISAPGPDAASTSC